MNRSRQLLLDLYDSKGALHMRSFLLILLISLFVGCNTEQKETTTRGKLHFNIPESIAPVIIDEVGDFLRVYKDYGAQITYTIVSTDAAAAHFVDDTGRIAILPRQLSKFEKEKVKNISSDLNELIIAYDCIIVVVHPKNNFEKLTTTDIQKILAGSITQWDQIPNTKPTKGAIKIYLQDSSDVSGYLTHRLVNANGIKAKFVGTSSDLQTIQSVSKDISAIGFVALSWLDSAKSDVKVLNIGRTKDDTDTTFTPPQDAVGKFYSPDLAYIYLNYYPLKRAIYMYTHAKTDLAMGFGTYVSTAEGQKLFLKRGLLPGTQKIKLRAR
jgi:phosphate transport system substrate-binding protein